ncbi:aminopeptidase [Ramlibacter tataouinensis]|uniref:aminopeptidase n=1 Tax=Ramlibacter tataouinensis TaxID=94132 RepID=UPI0022F3A238|nr:aminopeptidase [Ramlibacter tataouinensis]WBY00693.1 aminopeptidase [Ramlibacter tataouinensis]
MKGRWLVASALGAAVVAASLLCLSGCANLGYYWQSATGHLRVMNASRPVQEWLGDERASPGLKQRLELSQRIRSFASGELHLPDNPSYRRYADLHRSAVIWNVVAAPEFSLTLKTWCFPVTGCVGYRGYFDEAEARAEADQLRGEGYEASSYPVPAYSTLGWMNWAGGDPLLNTFIHYPEGELARLIFHELAHQVVYARDDTMFNESFATAVERLGVQRWLQEEASPEARADYARYDGRRRDFRALTRTTREKLDAVYDQKASLGDEEVRRRKAQLMADFRADYRRLREAWGVEPARLRGYDNWVAGANNASFGAQKAYDGLVPGFEALFHSLGGDWQRFYAEVKRLAALPKAERHDYLKHKEKGRA